MACMCYQCMYVLVIPVRVQLVILKRTSAMPHMWDDWMDHTERVEA